MNATQLVAHFERISDAPQTVPRLRQFILDVAVRGKLVPQDPSDAPASELLKCVEVLSGPMHAEEDMLEPLFAIPPRWAWVTLGSICLKTGSGSTPRGGKAAYHRSGVPFLRSQNVYNDGLRLNDVAYIDRATHERMASTAVLPGDLLLNITGGSTGRCCRIPSDFGEGNVSQHVAIVRPAIQGIGDFLQRQIISPAFQAFVMNEQTGAGRGGLPKNRMDRIPVALPPLAEQHRIAAKVDELMKLCDELEAAQKEREERRNCLAAASLARLNQPADDVSEFREHARFHLRHLPRLLTKPEHIKQLRQTILNLAIRGRLVEQDPKDEPASAMLQRKVALPVGYKRRRKILKKTPVATVDGSLPGVPQSWQYRTVQDLYDLNIIVDYADGNHGSLYPRRSEFGHDGVRFVTAKDLSGGRVEWAECARLKSERANQLTKGWAEGGDILLTHNATVGRVAIVEPDAGRFLLGTSVTFFRLAPAVLAPRFFFHMLGSSLWQGQLSAVMEQTTRNQVSIQKQAFFAVVVPPIAEQHRIASKVDDLMAICDQLDAHLTAKEAGSQRLLEAVLHEALAEAA